MKKQNISSTGLEDLSSRTRNVLSASGIYSLQELIDFCGEHGFRNLKKLLKGFGFKALTEVECLLERVAPGTKEFAIPSKSTFFIIKDIVYSDVNIQTTPIQLIRSLSDRVKNALVSKGILTIKDLIDFCEENGLEAISKIKNIGTRSFQEVRDFLQPTDNHIDKVISELQNFIGPREELTETEMVEILKKASSLLKQKNQDEKAKSAKVNIIKKSTNQKEM